MKGIKHGHPEQFVILWEADILFFLKLSLKHMLLYVCQIAFMQEQFLFAFHDIHTMLGELLYFTINV